MASPTRRPYHQINTPRLIIRSATHSDAQAIADLRGNPKNNPYMSVEPGLSAEVFQKRIVDWTASAERGENAFMVIILRKKSILAEQDSGKEGTLIGFGGFNSLHRGPALDDPTKDVLVGDTGIMIDHLQWRKGYALEALCATVEYGLYTLGCEHITIDTRVDNEPWRGLTRSAGLEGVEIQRNGGSEEDPQTEWNYRFGRNVWEKARENMIVRGKWAL
jgi:RimJ/RimL family protein N-acetyltransferase